MKAFNLTRIAGGILCAWGALIGAQPTRAAAPVFRAAYSFTNTWVELKGFNNAGDILAGRGDPNNANGGRLYGILRDQGTVEVQLTPVTNVLAVNASATAMSQRREDGHVFVTGTAACTDNYTRACVWDVAPDGTYAFTLGALASLPPDSQLPNTKVSSFGVAVNNSGVVAGGAETLALDSMPVRWAPPYNAPQRFDLSEYTGANFVDIDNDGNMLANSVEFERGTTNEHFSGALVRADGTVIEIPPLISGMEIPPGNGFPTYSAAVKINDDWVVGSAAVSTNRTAAFAWRVGAPNIIELPPSDFLPWGAGTAWSVNSSGQILGGGATVAGVDGLTLWQYETGNFLAYTPWRLIPADSYYPGAVSNALLNDQGELAMVYFEKIDVSLFKTILRVYEPVSDGVVYFYNSIDSASETYGPAEFTVQLARAAANNGRVTVIYRTVDGTAKAGINYVPVEGTITWEAGDSADKKIKVTLIDNVEFDESKTFDLELTSPTGAQLSQSRTSTRYFDEWDPYVSPQNEIYVPVEGGVQPSVAAQQGVMEAIVRLERLGGFDGKMTVTNFTATGYSATEGVDFTLPQGLSAAWAAGEGGVKTISIPLLAHLEVLTNRFFMMSANTQVEGALQPVRVDLRFGVMILPKNTDAYLSYRRPALVNGKLKMEALGVQGTTIELLKAPTLDGPWTVAGESGGMDGFFPFEADVNAGAKAEFFQFRQKP